jgi:tRNA threonylcarbamoyladenosine biosynthesis protein TsaE
MDIIEQLTRGVSTGSPDETRALAAELAARLPPDTALALHGDLGAGKTTFVQGLARGLGVLEPVTSPTFAIFNVLRPSAGAPGGRLLVHLDGYRIESEAALDALMLDDFLVSPWCLAVEWPEKVPSLVPPGSVHLDLSIAGERHTLKLRG